jgi:hypothetical protein
LGNGTIPSRQGGCFGMHRTSSLIALFLTVVLCLGSTAAAQTIADASPLIGLPAPAAAGCSSCGGPASPYNNIPPGLSASCADPAGCDCGPTVYLERTVHGDPCFPCEPKTYGCPDAPFWYVEADAIAMLRDPDDSRVLATLGPVDPDGNPAPVVALGTSDLEFGFQPGGRIMIGRMLGQRYGIEATFSAVDDWYECAAVRDNTPNAVNGVGNLFSPFTDFGNPAVDGLDYNNLVTLRESSSFYSIEFNIRQRLEMPPIPLQTSLLYGVRYINIGEDFSYYTESDLPSANAVDVDAENQLLGVQLGALFDFHVEPRWWVNLRMTAALCGNDARQDTIYTATDAEGVSTDFVDGCGKTVTAFVGELSLACTYHITPHLMTRIGYRGMWIEGLALAEENFNDNIDILTLGPAGLVDDGKVIYHGPFLGTAMVW